MQSYILSLGRVGNLVGHGLITFGEEDRSPAEAAGSITLKRTGERVLKRLSGLSNHAHYLTRGVLDWDNKIEPEWSRRVEAGKAKVERHGQHRDEAGASNAVNNLNRELNTARVAFI